MQPNYEPKEMALKKRALLTKCAERWMSLILVYQYHVVSHEVAKWRESFQPRVNISTSKMYATAHLDENFEELSFTNIFQPICSRCYRQALLETSQRHVV